MPGDWCGEHFKQLKELDKGLSALRIGGLGPGTTPYETLWKARGAVMAKMGLISPRAIFRMGIPTTMSPAQVQVWFDIEAGWMAEGRREPGALPVYRSIPAELAIAILKEEATPEQLHALLEPDPYVGE